MLLSKLLAPLGISQGFEEAEISQIVYDSRKAVPGSLFVCLRGAASDGHSFAAKATGAGARVIVAEEAVSVQLIEPIED